MSKYEIKIRRCCGGLYVYSTKSESPLSTWNNARILMCTFKFFFSEINGFIFLRWNAFKPPQATQLQTLTKAQKIKER
jgi:hypothetical protein